LAFEAEGADDLEVLGFVGFAVAGGEALGGPAELVVHMYRAQLFQDLGGGGHRVGGR